MAHKILVLFSTVDGQILGQVSRNGYWADVWDGEVTPSGKILTGVPVTVIVGDRVKADYVVGGVSNFAMGKVKTRVSNTAELEIMNDLPEVPSMDAHVDRWADGYTWDSAERASLLAAKKSEVGSVEVDETVVVSEFPTIDMRKWRMDPVTKQLVAIEFEYE